MERGADPLTGRVLDARYQVGAKIARGGMATVYQARDLRLDRDCAVKVMHPDLRDDETFAARFVREAQSAARLSHPHVVAVTDQGDDDGLLFLVMEHVRGRTLRDVIREEAPMAPQRALELLEPVLAALAEAHRSGLVHRDVKPENVLIADDGRVKVADFGLARAFDANSQHTATGGVLIGTVSYLAPELIVDGKADPRSDVYAAGVLLYEMLTGRKPHEGEGAIQIAFKHVNEDVPAPSAATEQPLPAYVDALVRRATARERVHRQADAKVFLQQARRVRAALEAGDADDAELTADLLPAVVTAPADSIDYTEDDSPAVPVGLGTVPAADEEDTTVLARSAPSARESVVPAAANASAVVAGAGTPGPPRSARGLVTAQGPVSGAVATAPRPDRPGARTPVGTMPPPPRSAPPGAGGGAGGGSPVGRRPRRSRRGRLRLLIVVLLAALLGYAGWWLAVGRYTPTPGVINLSVAAAADKLATAGLDLDVAARRYSETVTAGSVISTEPSAGSRILEGGTVEAVVSKGPERYSVPQLAGKPLSAVEDLLSARHLALDEVTREWSQTVDKGVVVSSSPAPGTELRRDSAVDVRVSKGPEPIRIPDFTDRSGDRARERLDALGFDLEVSEEHSDEVPKGRVISQSPHRGTGFRGDTINVVVSKGPVMVTVPSVQAQSVEEATAALEAVGLRIAVERNPLWVGLDRVVQQDPSAGELLPRGSTVTVSTV